MNFESQEKLIMEIHSESRDKTIELGRALGTLLKEKDVLGLKGELGCGKTTLVTGVMGAFTPKPEEFVNSPTYTLLNEYPADKGSLIHVDLYRLQGRDDLENIGYWEYAGQPGYICIVEWPERVEEALEDDSLLVSMEYADSMEESKRTLRLYGNDNWRKRVEEVL